MPDPGELRQTIAIEEIVRRVPDGAGGYLEVWATIPRGDKVWARIEPLRGEERLRAMQQRSNATHEVTIRWREGVTSLCRVFYQGRKFEVTEPPRDEDERRHWLRFNVREEP